ncbi:capsule biosynthesis protein CapG [Pediococcus pentosaceus]|uniref:Stealth CR1 domain-containing protein n=1 Tax=Pediococcus pentosaceus TaxID=1255 RepID=UPI0010087F83|nr:Stealth CR1 domain-containing protein [Pediococcus pentosaceus]RXI21055.1 capsule biosynthesis protein CapG [Pediococcus pentosaceus]
MKIDFVVTWVDGSDPKWLQSKNEYLPTDEIMNTDIRYRDYGTFKYWFRAIEKNAPWVNKVYLVTEGHLPEWINKDAEKLVIVKHADYIEKKYLPTFNSNVIELNLHKISDLEEHFVLFNDDVFILNKTEKKDFFDKGLPKEYGVYSPVVPYREFSSIEFNDVKIINKYFNKRSDFKKNFFKIINAKYGINNLRTLMTLMWPNVLGYWNPHITAPFLKETFYDVWKKEKKLMEETSSHKFRTTDDINQWLMRYFQIEEGKFIPQKAKFGKKVTLNEFSDIEKIFKSKAIKVACINDDFDVKDYDSKMERLINLFEKRYPEKSSFEI